VHSVKTLPNPAQIAHEETPVTLIDQQQSLPALSSSATSSSTESPSTLAAVPSVRPLANATTFPPLQVADGGGTLSQPGLVAMVPQAQANGRDCEEGELYQFSSDKIETALSCCKRKKNSRCNYATHLLACQYLNQTAVCPTVQVYVASSQSARVSSMPSKRKYSLLSP